VGLDVVGDGGVLAAADVLADVRDSLLDATRDVVATVGHAADDRGEVYFAVLRVLAGTTFEYALYVAESQTVRGHIFADAAVGVVVVPAVERLFLLLVLGGIRRVVGRLEGLR
jgi:hypothetical protein